MTVTDTKVPHLGASVIYTNPRGEECAAIVTRVYRDADAKEVGMVDLTAFNPGLGHPPTNHIVVPCRELAPNNPGGSWSWPQIPASEQNT